MCWGVVAVAAISAYAANGGKFSQPPADQDWLEYEKQRAVMIRREAAAVRRQALFGAVLFALAGCALVYAVASLVTA